MNERDLWMERRKNSPHLGRPIGEDAANYESDSGRIIAIGADRPSGMIVGLIAFGICLPLSAFSVWVGWWLRGVMQ
jgi:hypothetical protein